MLRSLDVVIMMSEINNDHRRFIHRMHTFTHNCCWCLKLRPYGLATRNKYKIEYIYEFMYFCESERTTITIIIMIA